MAVLRILSGDNKGKLYELNDDKLVIGRDSEQIPVMDQGVSRQHAEVFRIGEMYFLRDLESRKDRSVPASSRSRRVGSPPSCTSTLRRRDAPRVRSR